MMDLNFPDRKQQEFVKTYEYSTTKFAVIVSIGVSGGLCVIAVCLILCFGKLNRKCKTMRMTLLALAFIYLLCIIQNLLTGVYWLKYAKALNEVMENPTSADLYAQVSIETVQATGGLATIRISTQLAFYNCGFLGLAMLLCIIAAHLIKTASCHTRSSISYTDDYKLRMYSDDQLTANGLLLGRGSSSNSGDNGIATPDQIVTPQRSIRSYDVNLLQARSDSTMRVPASRFYSHNNINGTSGTNTYISYKDVDSIEKIDRLSQPLMVTTLDRSTIRSTQV